MASPDAEISFDSHPSETATIEQITGSESQLSQNYESADDRRHVRFGESSDSRYVQFTRSDRTNNSTQHSRFSQGDLLPVFRPTTAYSHY